MFTISPDFLRLTGEAVVLLRRGRIVFANDSAKRALGADCTEKAASAVFGSDLTSSQSLTFSAMSNIAGRNYIVRSSVSGDIQAIFFALPDDSGVMMTDAMLCALRSGMMTMNISASAARDAAEALGDARLGQSIASITEQSHRVSRLINNASVAKCVSEGNVPFAPTPHDAALLCSDIVDSVALLRKDIAFSYSGPDRLVISCDRSLTELMLLNLISNSLTHAEGATQIKLSLMTSGEMVHFTVSDNGTGMSEDELGTVFTRFKRTAALSDMGRGAGFGMTVVRGVAAAHGGTLLLESSPSRGTIVRVSFSTAVGCEKSISAGSELPQGMEPILTGLAGCIPTECYTAKYFD